MGPVHLTDYPEKGKVTIVSTNEEWEGVLLLLLNRITKAVESLADTAFKEWVAKA